MNRQGSASRSGSFCLHLILLALAITDLHAQSFVPAGRMTTPRLGHSAFAWDASAQAPGTFVPTGSMTTPRFSHTATLLKDGRVLITGGQELDNRNCLKSAELYDPATGTFTATGDMSNARSWHAAALLPDGRVFVIGGCNDLISADVYDPATGTFTPVGEFPGMWWSGFSATLLKAGKVLLSGGLVSDPRSALALLYDPATNKFSSTGISRGRPLSTASLLPDGTVLIAGGWNSGRWSPFAIPPPDAPTVLYNPAADRFDELITGPGRSIYHSATSLTNGKVLFAGGASDDYGEVAESQATLYDPAARIFKTTGNLLLARDSHTGTLLKDGRVLVTGGFNGNGGDSIVGIFSSAELYDPFTETFVAAGNMSRGRDGHTATLLTDGRVLIAGGRVVYRQNGPPIPNDATAELFVPASIEGQVPSLSLDKTQYCAGDSWRLHITDAAASSSVQLMGISLGTPWEMPNWRTTNVEGTLIENGIFRADAVGDHTLWALADGKTSNSIVFKIVACGK
jgi:Galactose oxidase, central domain